MNTKSFFAILISVLVIFVLCGWIYLALNKKQIVTFKKEQTVNLPEELGLYFDESVDPAVFNIFTSDVEDKTLNLNYVWPAIYADNKRKVVSKITCKDDDIKLTTRSNETPVNISLDTLFKEVQNNPSEYMIFSGICKNTSCDEIYKNCKLHLGNR